MAVYGAFDAIVSMRMNSFAIFVFQRNLFLIANCLCLALCYMLLFWSSYLQNTVLSALPITNIYLQPIDSR